MKTAIVIQRYGPDILGGAEQLAGVVASVLKRAGSVTVLTTTAKDHLSWASHYEPGESLQEGITVLRFPVDYPRDDYFHKLHALFLNGIPVNDFLSQPEPVLKEWHTFVDGLPNSFQEEMIRAQGPYATALFLHLHQHQDEYDRILFFTYLYATTYYGLSVVKDKTKVRIYPTLHDEPMAYLKLWKQYTGCRMLFSTQQEKLLAQRILGEVTGDVVHYGLKDQGDIAGFDANDTADPYILYAGRIEHSKGIDHLLEYFIRYRQKHNASLRLKLIGRCAMEIPYTPEDGVYLLGFVEEDEKLKLFARAMCLVVPSPNESLSIVLLEAFMMSSPVLVNGLCKVLEDHISQSGGGMAYSDYAGFSQALELIVTQPKQRQVLGEKGRAYYFSRYEWNQYIKGLLEAVERS